MKILLGGIPLGCDNIGDEAIVACVVGMLKDADGEPQPWTMDEKIEFRPGETKSVGPVAVPEKFGV